MTSSCHWNPDVAAHPALFSDAPTEEHARQVAALRAEHPVSQDPATGLWLVTRYDDIRAVLLDSDTFRPDNALLAITRLSPAAKQVLTDADFALPAMLANNSGPSHAELRRLSAQFFTAQRVEQAIPRIRTLAQSAAGRVRAALAADPDVDLVELVTAELPGQVLLHLLGLDRGEVDLSQLIDWSARSLELFWGRPDGEGQLALAASAAAFYRWIASQLDAATGAGPDLFSVVAAHRDLDGAPLSRHQATSLCYFVLIAGHQTTSQLLATALRRLIGDAEVWRRLGQATDGERFAQACVEEVLRLEPPVTTWRRVLSQPATLAGVDLPAGAELLLMLAASGTDEAAFADPYAFHPTRETKTPHLAFGYGRHFCLGAAAARTEAAITIATLARELPGLRLNADEPPHVGLLSFNAPTRIAVGVF
ncbi:MAG: hypothetical protein JWO63_2524 [Frankiales bacterium]|nr:hypothetical protein [Frankiales bacterium]